jgi:hypothetical protein
MGIIYRQVDQVNQRCLSCPTGTLRKLGGTGRQKVTCDNDGCAEIFPRYDTMELDNGRIVKYHIDTMAHEAIDWFGEDGTQREEEMVTNGDMDDHTNWAINLALAGQFKNSNFDSIEDLFKKKKGMKWRRFQPNKEVAT